MVLISKIKTLLAGALAVTAAALATVAPAQATPFDEDDGVEEVGVVKKRVARPIYHDDEFDRPRSKRVIVEKRVVGDFDDDDFRTRTVVVKERIVRPAYGFHSYSRPRTVVVKERVVHPDHGFYGYGRAGLGAGF